MTFYLPRTALVLYLLAVLGVSCSFDPKSPSGRTKCTSASSKCATEGFICTEFPQTGSGTFFCCKDVNCKGDEAAGGMADGAAGGAGAGGRGGVPAGSGSMAGAMGAGGKGGAVGGEGGTRIPNGGTPDSGTERDAPQVQGSGGGRADAQTIVRADASVLCDAGAAGCSGQCPAMTHNCGGLCASNAGVNSCGATSCDPCTAPTNAMARCTAGACAWDCLPGFVKCGAACLTGTCCGDPDCKSTNPTFVCLNNKCGPPPDTKSPVVASVTPGVQGVPKDANLVVTFSEAMNRQKTEAAFAGPSLGPVKFSWSVADTVLTINPDADLSYAEGANPLAVTATPYSFTITSGATDVAGNPLPAYSYTFTTLRRISTRLRSASDTNLDGFAVANGSDDHPYDSHMAVGYSSDSIMKGFATIDLTALPGGITRFESALLGVWQNNLYGPDMSRVGSIQVEHVRFVTINAAAVNAARLRPLGVLSTNITSEWKERDVSAALQDDYADRQARLNRSQYRIFPEKATTGNFYIGYGTTEAGESYEPRITVVYLLP